MRLFTSSFNSGAGWLKTWLFGLLLAVVVLIFLEFFWRHNGFTPTQSDDQKMWSVERDRIGRGDKEIALIGSSRMLCDISMPTMKSLLPDYKVVNLAIDGSCPNDVLEDLANDNRFRGIVVCDITEECILFGSEGELSVKSFITFRDRVYSLNVKINRMISTFLQSRLTIIDPYLSLTKVFGEFLLKHKLRSARYWTINEDRSHSMDYSVMNIEDYKANRIAYYKKHLAQLEPNINIGSFLNRVDVIENYVRRIGSRGGKVVFVYLPMTDEHRSDCEKAFPVDEYWARFERLTSAVTVHFKDVPEMVRLKCPDTSHLDHRDTPALTEALVSELKRYNIVQTK